MWYKVINFFLWRNLRVKRDGTVRGEAIFTYGGFALSIAILSSALILLSSYQKSLKEGLLGINAHLYFFNPVSEHLNMTQIDEISSFLAERGEVDSFSPVKLTQLMAVGETNVKGVNVRSIEWEKDRLPTDYYRFIKQGSGRLDGVRNVVIGSELAKHLQISVGDEFRLVTPRNIQYTVFGLKMTEESVLVKGIFHSGIFDTDSNTIFANESLLTRLLKNGDNYTLVEVKLKEPFVDRSDELKYAWTRSLDFNYLIHSWIDFNGNLFQMLVLQRWVIFIILSFIVLIAAFNIVSSTATSIIERKKELAILKAIGCSDRFLKSMVLGKVLVTSLYSIIGGILAGIGLAFILTKQSLYALQGDVYFLERFTLHIDYKILFVIFSVSLSIALFSTILPLRKTSQLTITEILRSS